MNGHLHEVFILASALSVLSSQASTKSGTLNPKVFASAIALLTRSLSLSSENGLKHMTAMSPACSARSRAITARVLMSAAVSDPRDDIFSAFFFGQKMAPSTVPYSFLTTSTSVGGLMVPSKIV